MAALPPTDLVVLSMLVDQSLAPWRKPRGTTRGGVTAPNDST
jgi:hypothetical protein